MPTTRRIVLGVIAPLLLALSGCTSLTGAQRDAAGGSETAQASPFDLERLPEQVESSWNTLIGKGVNPQKARELYVEAEGQYQAALRAESDQKQDAFAQAAKQFNEAAGRWPDSALEEDAMFMAGEAYFFADMYPKANEAWEKLLKKYSNSKHLDAVESRRFAIAQFWLDLHNKDPESFWEFNWLDSTRPTRDTFGNSVRVYDRIRLDDPTGKLADDATLAAGNAYFAKQRYLDADGFYTDLRKTFPGSEHQYRAHLLGLKAKLLTYEGTDYSGAPLDEAEKLIKQIQRQFPQEAAQEREYLARAYAEVRFKKAEREWSLAQYYDRRGEYGAARFYYDILTREFAETPFAEKARSRMGEVASEPAVPPQRLQWLVEAFPKEENSKPLMATSDSGKKRR
jgi:outer membrane protein assembly factor BamD (BamD/ComL family)